jgi:DNA-binding NarL/FixJ family response regulator
MIRVLIADDQELVRSGFAMILEAEADITVVGEAEDGYAALAASGQLDPDVVLMDIRMPGLDGIEATRRLRATAGPQPKILILTTFDLDEYLYEAMKSGASGFLLKDAPKHELIHAVRSVAAGDALLAPVLTRRLIEQYVRRPPPGARSTAELAALTERELEVLRCLGRGQTNAEIAAELYLSQATIRTHVSHILAKLNLRDRVQAVVLAYETGLIQPGQS